MTGLKGSDWRGRSWEHFKWPWNKNDFKRPGGKKNASSGKKLNSNGHVSVCLCMCYIIQTSAHIQTDTDTLNPSGDQHILTQDLSSSAAAVADFSVCVPSSVTWAPSRWNNAGILKSRPSHTLSTGDLVLQQQWGEKKKKRKKGLLPRAIIHRHATFHQELNDKSFPAHCGLSDRASLRSKIWPESNFFFEAKRKIHFV